MNEAESKRASGGRPRLLHLLLAVLAFESLSGLAGGYALMADPEGFLPVEWLEGSPFADYFIPGAILFTIVGVMPLVVIYGLARRRLWAWWLALADGLGQIIWILTEVAIVGFLPGLGGGMQILYGLVGAVIVALPLTPSLRAYFGVGPSGRAVRAPGSPGITP